MHKEGNEPCFIYTIKYDCTTFTSRVNVLYLLLHIVFLWKYGINK